MGGVGGWAIAIVFVFVIVMIFRGRKSNRPASINSHETPEKSSGQPDESRTTRGQLE